MKKQGKKPLYIEFVGIPGAGKTTIGKETLEKLARKYIVDTYIQRIIPSNNDFDFFGKLPKNKKFFLFTKSLVKNLPVILLILKFYLSLRPFTFERRERKNLLSFTKMFLSVEAMKINNLQANILFVDRGFINMLVTVTLNKKFKKKKLEELLKNLYRNLLLVLVIIDIDPNEAFYRVKNRLPKGDCRENLSKKEALAEYKTINAKMKLILDLLQEKNFTGPQLCISGKESAEKNVPKIISFIENTLSKRDN